MPNQPPNPKTYRTMEIASYIIKRGKQKGIDITSLKLQKLIYLCHGWYLTFTSGVPLVNDRVEAWKYGPVFSGVYRETAKWGDKPIGFIHNYDAEIDDDAAAIIDQVLDQYSDTSAIDLVKITHKKGSPWDVTTNSGKDVGYRKIIPDSVIQKHYDELSGKV